MEVLADRLSYEQQRGIHNSLATTTLKHVASNGSLFGELDFDPVANPSQDLRNVHLPAVPTTPKEADDLATIANPRLYPYMRDVLKTQGLMIGELRKMRDEAGSRDHVGIVSTHQTMPDIAIVEVAFSVAEHELYDTNWPTIINNNGLIISRGVGTLQAFGLAASEVAQKAGDVFMSFPRTETIEELKLQEELDLPEGLTLQDIIDDNNLRMRKELQEWSPYGPPSVRDILTAYGQLPSKKRTYIAWSGSTDKTEGDPFNPERVVLERAHGAIISHLKHGSTLPTVVWDRGEEREPIFITGELTTIRKDEDIERVQEWQRHTLARALGIDDSHVSISSRHKND